MTKNEDRQDLGGLSLLEEGSAENSVPELTLFLNHTKSAASVAAVQPNDATNGTNKVRIEITLMGHPLGSTNVISILSRGLGASSFSVSSASSGFIFF